MKEFIEWLDSDNVIKLEGGLYTTQLSFFADRLTYQEIMRHFFTEYFDNMLAFEVTLSLIGHKGCEEFYVTKNVVLYAENEEEAVRAAFDLEKTSLSLYEGWAINLN